MKDSILKIQVPKNVFGMICDGTTDSVPVEMTPMFVKRLTGGKHSSVEKVMEDMNSVVRFDRLYVSCMFSDKNITVDIEDIRIEGKNVVFKFTRVATDDGGSDVVDTVSDETQQTEPAGTRDTPDTKSLGERVDEILDELCRHKNVYVVGVPRVMVKPDGVVFGTGKKLPIKNDVAFSIVIEAQKLYFTYDITEEDYLKQLRDFFKRMTTNNFVFLWRKKSRYMEIDGRRFLLLRYTTRRFVNQNKNITYR